MIDVHVKLIGKAMEKYRALQSATGLPDKKLFDLMMEALAKFLKAETGRGNLYDIQPGMIPKRLILPGKLAEPFDIKKISG